MLKPYRHELRGIAFVFAHTGIREDGGNRAYAVAAAILGPEGPRRSYESLIRYPYFTARERYYSNLSRDVLETAPDPGAVRTELAEFLRDRPVVLAYSNEGAIDDVGKLCPGKRIIDLGFAAEFFFPQADAFSPKRLWEFFHQQQRERIYFTASETIELSLELVEQICGRQLNDEVHPRAAAVRFYLEKSDTLFGKTFLHIARNYERYFGGLFHPCNSPDRSDWKQFLEAAAFKKQDRGDGQSFRKVRLDGLDGIFQGVSKAVGGFNFRPSQAEYARHVAGALNDGAVLTIEAGTGTGKTQGYLIPVMEFLRRNAKARVAVSTYTKSLQDQIMGREITFLRDSLKACRDIPVALLKGKSNYLCAEKLDTLYDEDWRGGMLLAWLYLVNLVFQFREADGDRAGERIRRYLNDGAFLFSLQREASAKSGCNGSRHIRCPAQVVAAAARAARLIVTNHHKLALLGQDPVLAGLFNICIIDEANHFEQAVRNAFGLEVSSRETASFLEYLQSSLEKILGRAAGEPEKDIRQAIAAIADLDSEITILGRILKGLKAQDRPAGGTHELPAGDQAFAGGHISTHLENLRDAIGRIEAHLEWVKDEDICRMLKVQARTRERLKITLSDLVEQGETLRAIAGSMVLENRLAAYEVFLRHWSLISQEIDVAEIIRMNLYKDTKGIVYTSATLCQDGSFDPFKAVAGLDRPFFLDEQMTSAREFRFVSLPSPFSEDALETIVHPDAVGGNYRNKGAWLEAVTRLLPGLILKNRGRTLVLFSSYRDLEAVGERIAEQITGAGFPLLMQHRGYPTGNLCDEFRAIKESVLFGVDTFWYGVDFKGDTLTQVIITRIPYASPADPLQRARRRMMSPADYRQRYLYDTYIKLKQGIGRLIRCETDRGRVVILDARYPLFRDQTTMARDPAGEQKHKDSPQE